MRNLLIIIIGLVIVGKLSGYQSEKEVLIIGTMHDVPNIVKHSYKPLLKIGKKYKPEAIYVERQRPDDSLSLVNYESKWFLPKGDTLREAFKVDVNRIQTLQQLGVKEMSPADYAYLRDYYMVSKDKGNWSYYNYLANYGLKGSRKPTQEENGDLTAKLAIHLNMNRVFAMDHQHDMRLYSKLWSDCVKMSKEDGEVDRLVKHNKRTYNKAKLPAIFGRLGKHTNKVKTIKSYEVSNRFTFRETPCEPCDQAGAVWDRRNAGMAKNIGDQMEEFGHQRAVVVVGAGHVLGIREQLQKQFPDMIVKIIEDL
ncbi:DUF5694 domain-containing protein [Roseivirga misakiensis]|uniref:Uncharacterized protein n=1 Tax=Roseivirga misakiensis TaxID=1563681 RepID=A0A1E5SL13_9BACT|nr:DUF5694 domain-containing protein [Roseivirga misakiensis]OEJ99812.1 hypothetical protein BFP71_09665 [Roseivirga misakiensis]